MDTLIHADIFFFVTTVVVIVVGMAFTIALIYLVIIFKRIRDIAEQVKEETVLFREDIHSLRDTVRQGITAKAIFSIIQRFVSGGRKSKGK